MNHTEVVEVIRRQVGELIHMIGTDFYYHHQSDLAELLVKITPGKFPKKVFLANTGAESVEAALKLSRYYTKRPRFIAYIGAFHGRTFGALALTSSKAVQRRYFAPLLPEVTHIPYPYCYRCVFNLDFPKCNFACLSYLEDVIFKKVAPPEEIAAVIVEPIQGEGGYVVPPDGYFQRLRKLCDRYDILLVVDEVQSGMGRTGKMFAIEHWKTVPDMICIGKGVASGLPLSAMVSRAEFHVWPSGAHANTFGGNPVSCVAAIKTIELLQRELINNAAQTGAYMLNQLQKLKDKYEFIGDVRGKGLMIGVEIVKDKQSKLKDTALRDKIVERCFKRGLLILGCGDNNIRFIPPLIVTKNQIDIALEIFERALKG